MNAWRRRALGTRRAAILGAVAVLLLLGLVALALRGPGAGTPRSPVLPWLDPETPLDVRVELLLAEMTLQEKIAQLHGTRRMQAPRNPRLGIPDFRPTDGPHGVNRKGGRFWERGTRATAFPVSLALAATWDPQLAREMGGAIAREARALGRNWLLAPCVNIVRDPRGGRTQESFGEDPLLAGRMAAAFVEGVQEQSAIATPKHFVCNNQETRRDSLDVVVEERALREIYLAPFEAAVGAGALSVMSAYNGVNGRPMVENRGLLRGVLMQEWGFRGIVVSDWESVRDGVGSLAAGVHVEMPKPTHYGDLAAAVRAGAIAVERIDESVRRVLRVKLAAGLFEPPGPAAQESVHSTAHRNLALEVARRSIVLLANQEGMLPLDVSEIDSLLVVGPNAAVARLGDDRSSEVLPFTTVSPLEGIRRYAGDRLAIEYVEGSRIDRPARGDALERAQAAAARAQAVVAVLGLDETQEGEARDRVGNDVVLPAAQTRLLEAVMGANPATVLVLVGGSALALPASTAQPAALLHAWYPGERGGEALAEVLFGETSPAGRLPITLPRTIEQLPAYPSFPDRRVARYDEGVFVGYRFFDRRGLEPWFPFGHGLSYTRFVYTGLSVLVAAGAAGEEQRDVVAEVLVEVANVGDRAGDEVVQLYLADRESRLPRPPRELKGFRRLTLRPGETRSVRFELGARDLSYWDPDADQWILEPGIFEAMVGSSSRDIRLRHEFAYSSSPTSRISAKAFDLRTTPGRSR